MSPIFFKPLTSRFTGSINLKNIEYIESNNTTNTTTPYSLLVYMISGSTIHLQYASQEERDSDVATLNDARDPESFIASSIAILTDGTRSMSITDINKKVNLLKGAQLLSAILEVNPLSIGYEITLTDTELTLPENIFGQMLYLTYKK